MKNIRLNLLIPTLLMAAFSLGAIIAVSFVQYQAFQEQAKQTTGRRTSQLKNFLQAQQQKNRDLIHLLKNKWQFVDSITLRDMNDILDEIVPYHGQMNYGLITLYDMNGLIIARADKPYIFGKPDELTPLVLRVKDNGHPGSEAALFNGKTGAHITGAD